MTISAKGVLVVAPAAGETLKYWKAIRKVTETASHVYLFVGLAQAFVLPKRAFASNEAMEAFLAKVKEYRALAAPPSPPSGTMSS